MAFKNILVAFNGTETSKSAARLAILIAKTNDAHLTALFVQAPPNHYASIGAWLPEDTMQMLVDREIEHAREVSAMFRDICLAEGMDRRTNMIRTDGQANTRIVEFARTYDLVVIGQPQSDFWEGGDQAHPDTVALQSGRPVMIAPPDFSAVSLNKGAVVAWDGKRAAARALADSIDILRTTGPVTVVHVGDSPDAVRQPGRDVMEHLSRHGISGELRVTPRAGRKIGDILLEACQTEGAGILVMGAYQHSQFSEELIGGVTKDVLSKTRLPVLMSH
ncbi:MAG: universal stress protein [Pseudomonadota bacterium]